MDDETGCESLDPVADIWRAIGGACQCDPDIAAKLMALDAQSEREELEGQLDLLKKPSCLDNSSTVEALPQSAAETQYFDLAAGDQADLPNGPLFNRLEEKLVAEGLMVDDLPGENCELIE